MRSYFIGSYRDVIDNMDLALAIYRAEQDGNDFIFVEVNQGVEEIEQVKREDLIGRKITDAFPGVAEFGLLDVLRRVYRTGVPERPSATMYTDNRISSWRENYIYRLDTGEFVAVYRDLPEQKQMEREMEYIARFPEENKKPVLRIDEEGTIIYSNQASEPFLDKWNIQGGDLIPENLWRLISEVIDTGIKGEVDISLNERTFSFVFVPVVRETYVNVYCMDISDRKKVEEELRKSEALFRGFMQSATDGFLMFDEDLRAIEVNDTWLQQSGFEREDVIGERLLDVFPGLKETGRYDAFLKVLETGEPVEYQAIESASDPSLTLDVSAFKMGDVLGLVARDVSERVMYQRRLEALHGHAAALGSAETMDKVADITRESLSKVLRFERGSLGVVDGSVLNHKYRWGIESSEEIMMPLDGPGITVLAVNSGKSIRIGNVGESELYVDTVGDSVIFSELAVPVIVSGNAVGLINIESENKDAFSELDQRLVETLASHVASAFSKIKHSERVSALHSFTLELGYSESVEEVVETTFRIMREGLGFQFSSFQLLGKEELFTVDTDGLPSLNVVLPLTGRGITTRAAREARTFLVGDVRLDPDFIKGSTDSLSKLAVPILVEDRVFGVLNVESLQLDAFSDEDAELLETLASNVASALSRLEYLEKIRASEVQLSALHQHSLSLNLADSTQAVVAKTLEILEQTLGFEYGSMGIVEGNEILSKGTFGAPNKGMRFPLDGPGLTVKAVNEAKTIVVGDVRSDPDYTRGSIDSLSELDVPIIVEDTVLGVLNVESPQLNFFTDDDVRLMEVLAQNVGATLTRLEVAEDKMMLERQVLVQKVQVEQEQKMSKMKTRFMSTATHDLRTPLTSIQGYTELIQMNDENLSESQRQYFTVIQRNVQRLTKLTDDLLEQQRLEEGRIIVTLEPVKVKDLIEEVRSELLPILGEKRQRLEVKCVDVVVGMDRLRVMQVLVNLLSNASKFSPEGGVIVVDVVEIGDGVRFSVSDQGVGIGEEDIGKLFTPFPGILVEDNVGGTGLGLSISRGIVELHGGRIWAESGGLGKGSTFTFMLPINKQI